MCFCGIVVEGPMEVLFTHYIIRPLPLLLNGGNLQSGILQGVIGIHLSGERLLAPGHPNRELSQLCLRG